MKRPSKGLLKLKASKDKINKIRERESRKKLKVESDKLKRSGLSSFKSSTSRMTGGSGRPTVSGPSTHSR